MPTYMIIYEATVTVLVEADTPEEAQEQGKKQFEWQMVEIDDVLDIEVIE